ncbi:MAG: hypothetical protein ACE5HQ_10955, partial [Gemmatimonadota bacterium]
IGIVVAGTLKFIVEPRQLSRFYALADRRALRRGAWISTLVFLAVYAMLVPIGIYAHRLIPGTLADTDLVVPTLLGGAAGFAPLTSAFLVVAMIAAAMSSLDSVLLVMASTWERDVVSLLRPESSEAAAVRATRGYVALFAVVTAVLAIRPPGSIVTLTAFSGSLYAACFFPAIVLGLHWRRGDERAVIGSFAVGIATLVLWRQLPFRGLVHPVFPALALSTLAYAAAALGRAPVAAAEKLRAGGGFGVARDPAGTRDMGGPAGPTAEG